MFSLIQILILEKLQLQLVVGFFDNFLFLPVEGYFHEFESLLTTEIFEPRYLFLYIFQSLCKLLMEI